jgi:hypothetical protein
LHQATIIVKTQCLPLYKGVMGKSIAASRLRVNISQSNQRLGQTILSTFPTHELEVLETLLLQNISYTEFHIAPSNSKISAKCKLQQFYILMCLLRQMQNQCRNVEWICWHTGMCNQIRNKTFFENQCLQRFYKPGTKAVIKSS